MKRIYSLLIAVLCVVALTMPAKAWPVNPFLDVTGQIAGGKVEKYVFWTKYWYAMSNAPHAMPYYVVNSNIVSYTNTAVSRWNAIKPDNTDNMYRVFDPLVASIFFEWAVCPTSSTALGCISPTEWISLSGPSDVRTYYKASVYIKPWEAGGPYYYTATMHGILGHEIGHLLGLAHYYSWWDGCNPDYFTVMDGAHLNGNYWEMCDDDEPNAWDEARWDEYHFNRWYEFDYQAQYGDGTVVTYWRDRGWNDYKARSEWRWSNTSNGYFEKFADFQHINYNGSHIEVPPASGWRVNMWLNPQYYGLHNKWLKVCSFAIWNWQHESAEQCSPPFFYYY